MQTNTIAPSSGTATGFARYWQYRDLVRYQGVALSHVLIATAWTGVTLTVGTILFRRKARHLVEDL